jgi:hypothetical protein
MTSPRPASCRLSAELFSARHGVFLRFLRGWRVLWALLVLFCDTQCLRFQFCVPAIFGVCCFGRLYISGLCTARVYYSQPRGGMCHACRAFYHRSPFALFSRPHSGWLCTVCCSSPRRSAAKRTVCVRCDAVVTLFHATIALYALDTPAYVPRSACVTTGIFFPDAHPTLDTNRTHEGRTRIVRLCQVHHG